MVFNVELAISDPGDIGEDEVDEAIDSVNDVLNGPDFTASLTQKLQDMGFGYVGANVWQVTDSEGEVVFEEGRNKSSDILKIRENVQIESKDETITLEPGDRIRVL